MHKNTKCKFELMHRTTVLEEPLFFREEKIHGQAKIWRKELKKILF